MGWLEQKLAGKRQLLKSPCPPINKEKIIQVETEDQRISVSIVPGIMQKSPPDVMRGEETQIAGYLSKTQILMVLSASRNTYEVGTHKRERNSKF